MVARDVVTRSPSQESYRVVPFSDVTRIDLGRLFNDDLSWKIHEGSPASPTYQRGSSTSTSASAASDQFEWIEAVRSSSCEISSTGKSPMARETIPSEMISRDEARG